MSGSFSFDFVPQPHACPTCGFQLGCPTCAVPLAPPLVEPKDYVTMENCPWYEQHAADMQALDEQSLFCEVDDAQVTHGVFDVQVGDEVEASILSSTAERLEVDRLMRAANRATNQAQIGGNLEHICQLCKRRQVNIGRRSPLAHRSRSDQTNSVLDQFNDQYEAAEAMASLAAPQQPIFASSVTQPDTFTLPIWPHPAQQNVRASSSQPQPQPNTYVLPFRNRPMETGETTFSRPPVPFNLESHVNRPNYDPSKPSQVRGPFDQM